MKNSERKVISSTKKNNKVVAQQVIYTRKGYSETRHERILEDDKGNLKILSRKGVK